MLLWLTVLLSAKNTVAGEAWSDQFSPTRLGGRLYPQHLLDAAMLWGLPYRGATLRYSARVMTVAPDPDGVTATLDSGETIRANYLVAADGVRSGVRTQLGVGLSGPGALGEHTMTILFRADLTPYTQGYTFVNCTITTPEAPGELASVDGASEWIFQTPIGGENGAAAAEFTADRGRELIRAAVGDPTLAVEVLSMLSWRPRGQLADDFRVGRVFLVGDAAHAVPPVGAFGLDTGLADAHNLAWKLAAVLGGHAGQGLLDSYVEERRPVAKMTLEQALIRLRDPQLHCGDAQAADARAAAGAWNAPVVHLGYRYASGAVIDPYPRLPSTEDLDQVLDGTPGSRIPHRWISVGSSTLDMANHGFTLLAADERWIAAAEGLDPYLTAYDLGRPWAWWDKVGIGDTGALLVRPDQIIAYRAPALPDEPRKVLAAALRTLLARA
jgi:2-polyprenyl-6-methoxyphenol hydroxylase-like FAD-dependent oxidoreductase